MNVKQRFKDSSSRLINHFGATRDYMKREEATYNVETQMVEPSFTTYSCKMFKTEPKERELRSPNMVNRESSVMMIAASDLPFKPSIGDQIKENSWGEDTYFLVESVKENWASEGIASWRLVCVKV